MRRNLVAVLNEANKGLTLDDALLELVAKGIAARDNPHVASFDDVRYLTKAKHWEEAPLLDDLALSARYRGSILNLGLVGIDYPLLRPYLHDKGQDLATRLRLSADKFDHLVRCLLDEFRVRGAFGRPMLQYHPANPHCPESHRAADWERKLKRPVGYACSESGAPVARLDAAEMPDGITALNVWRQAGRGGHGPGLERKFRHLMERLGGKPPELQDLLAVLAFLQGGPQILVPAKLYGFKKERLLLQVNAECAELVLLSDATRMRCTVCQQRLAFVAAGMPCPSCHGTFQPWPEAAVLASRSARRIRKQELVPLVAGEHTAQVTGEDRIALEEDFKAGPDRSPVNVLACSPTLEMGIDVGGLDAVVLRNVPPRPDNYAQRGGRAGRRTRVGIVIGYARSTPHDGYFYEKPQEMIAGEVPAPGIGLGNRDIVMRHLHAIVFGAADPGLSGRMIDYIDIKGNLKVETIEERIAALKAKFDHATTLALSAWGPEIREPAGLVDRAAILAALEALPARVRDLFDRVRLQIVKLEETIQRWTEMGTGDRAATKAMELKRRLLGIRDERRQEADDRTSGNPMRRFGEFGILPGYEFPSEPCTLRLRGDPNEEDPISVERRFGIAQYQPEAVAHARGHRWKVVGLDLASPWNPKSDLPGWVYVRCKTCDLRYGAQTHASCPRCASTETPGGEFAGFEYGGFIAQRDDTPVLEEEDRFAMASLVRCNPQWNGQRVARYTLPTGWRAEVRHQEQIWWVNESLPPTQPEKERGAPYMHEAGRGFYLCGGCGKILTFPDAASPKNGIRTRARRTGDADPYGHADTCVHSNQPPKPHAIVAGNLATTLRLIVCVPDDLDTDDYQRWGQSLGYSLRTGKRQLYLLDGPEIEFELESTWKAKVGGAEVRLGALTFVDPAVGGSGFLERAAEELHLVAARAIEHLDHEGCETACYRCLKAYGNQRVHSVLNWPRIMPDLEALASEPPEPRELAAGDLDDPGPWLEAFASGVGSPLELRVLHLLLQHGIEVDKQVPISLEDGRPALTAADSVVKGTHLAIYVDGAAFHKGERLRRDRRIRRRLEDAGWTVVEVQARDLSMPDALVNRILAARTSAMA